ncbi:MAG: PAS domain S-box protein [Alphaproteobacteria bacterium]|nr:PAS domain S-box protein [Alphaproteobacteria bacterium]
MKRTIQQAGPGMAFPASAACDSSTGDRAAGGAGIAVAMDGRRRHLPGLAPTLAIVPGLAPTSAIPLLAGCAHETAPTTTAAAGTMAVPSEVTESEREEQYRALLTLAADAAYSYRVKGDGSMELEWSVGDRLLERLGWPKQASGAGCLALLAHQDDLPEVERWTRRLLAGEEVINTICVVAADGSLRWLRLHGRPERDRNTGRVCRIASVVHDVTEEVLREEQHRLVVQELHHRARNLLALVLGIGSATVAQCDSLHRFWRSLKQRLYALAATQQLGADGNAADLARLVDAVLRPFVRRDAGTVTLTGPAVKLPGNLVLTLALVVHELSTNAVKYGALSVPSGRVELAWKVTSADGKPTLRLEWRERDGPAASVPARRGFGSRLIQRAAGHGTAELDFLPEGVRCRLSFPLGHVRARCMQEARSTRAPEAAEDGAVQVSEQDLPRVLVVEDNLLIALETEFLVEQCGCAVVGPAASVSDALGFAGYTGLDGAVLDINLGREQV